MDKVIPNHCMYGPFIQPHRPKNDVSTEKMNFVIVINSTYMSIFLIQTSRLTYKYCESISFVLLPILTPHIALSKIS